MTDRGSSKKYVHTIASDKINRARYDFYPTPSAATWALLKVESFTGRIWEPACGDGAISRVLEAAGYDVVSSDLVNYGFGMTGVNFLSSPDIIAPNIITNPPFKFAERFIERAVAISTGKVAMLARLAFLEGLNRKLLFESTPLARVWVFSRRLRMGRGGVDFGKGSGGMIAFAWLVWDQKHKFGQAPELGWLDWKETGIP